MGEGRGEGEGEDEEDGGGEARRRRWTEDDIDEGATIADWRTECEARADEGLGEFEDDVMLTLEGRRRRLGLSRARRTTRDDGDEEEEDGDDDEDGIRDDVDEDDVARR